MLRDRCREATTAVSITAELLATGAAPTLLLAGGAAAGRGSLLAFIAVSDFCSRAVDRDAQQRATLPVRARGDRRPSVASRRAGRLEVLDRYG
jgi:hypothetical protein